MSDTTRTHLSHALAVAAMLTGATLARPGVIMAQTGVPEQALLNRVPATAGVPMSLHAMLHGPIARTSDEVTGEQALLGRTPLPVGRLEFEIQTSAVRLPAPPIDGAAALLGRREWVGVPK
jgi:hypothetical protein